MLIGIDAHNLESKKTGVGRYVFNLLKEWQSTVNSQQLTVKFILYFKDEIPTDIPQLESFERKLLNVSSTVKFMNWDLPRAARKDKVDVLFCPDYRGPIGYRGKMAITLHDISYEARPGDFNWPSWADKIFLKWASKKTAQQASVIFAPTEFVKNEVIKYYRVPAQKIVVTPEAVDPALLELPPDLEQAIATVKAKYGLKDKFGFYVGSIFSRRHLPELVAAFSRLAKESLNYQLLLAGRDYTTRQSVNRAAERLNQELGREAVVRVDFIEDSELKLLYSACAFFIWLSDYEGFGLPPLEAMSLGAPVITTEDSSLREVAGQAALLVKNNADPEEIYRAMRWLIDDSVLRQELTAKGRDQVARFSWKECAEETLRAIINLK